MTWIWRAAAIGAGSGLAAAAIDRWVYFFVVALGRPNPGWLTSAKNALVIIGVGAVLGLLNGVVLRSQRRAAAFAYLTGLCGAWLLVERWVWVDVPQFALLAYARTAAAGAFALVVLLLERSGRRFAVPFGAVAALTLSAVF